MRICQLDPGSAWNEAERRATPFGFVGFFVAGSLCAFGATPGIRNAFLAGICGAIGCFFGGIAFLIGLYSKKSALALIATPFITILPIITTAFLVPWIVILPEMSAHFPNKSVN